MELIEASENEVLLPNIKKFKVGLDLGTAYIVLVVLDEENNPVACEKQAARVLRDGVVVDFVGARQIVSALKAKLEKRLGTELTYCAIAMPAGTESSIKTHIHVAESAGLDVVNILDEPTAANSIYKIENGAVVDIGGGTTGLAVFQNGVVIDTKDEATGGTHVTLVLAGSLGISEDEAEKIKLDSTRHKEIFPIIKPVMEKMASIVASYITQSDVKTIYLCGGTCCMYGIEKVFENWTGIKTVKPDNPFLVTPAGIAVNCLV